MLGYRIKNGDESPSIVSSKTNIMRTYQLSLHPFGRLCRLVNPLMILMLAFALGASATTYSQKLVSLDLHDSSVLQLFREVKKQTGLRFVFNEDYVKEFPAINVSAEEEDVEELLNQIFASSPLECRFENDVVFIVKRTTPGMPQETVSLKGKVVDQKGMPLPGVTVQIKGTSLGVATDVNGNWHLDVPATDGITIVFSFVGMKTQEVTYTGQEEMNITMQEETEDLAEVIVTGYQTILKERATGSFSTINAERLETKLQPNLNSVLEGMMTGVVVDRKGNIEIRGVSTFNAEKDPLLVVDGYPIEGDIESINPENIENITVLKDAVAASIYGSRAANGVIVITTKRGERGSLNVSYKGTFSVTLKPDLSKLNRVSTEGYIDAELDLFNQNTSWHDLTERYPFGQATYYTLLAMNGDITQAEADAKIEELKKVDGLQQVEDHLFRNYLSHSHNIRISGGSETNLFNASINYLGERGDWLYTKGSRLILDLNNEWTPNKWVTFGAQANVVYRKDEAPYQTYENFLGWEEDALIQPYDNLIDPETGEPTTIFSTPLGKIARYEAATGMKDWTYNPIENLSKEMTYNEDFQVRLSGKLKINILEGLNIEAGGSWTRGSTMDKTVHDKDAYSVRIEYNDGTSKSNNSNHYFPDGAVIDESRSINESYTIRTQINFQRAFDEEKHFVHFLAGNEVRRSTYDNNVYATRLGYNETAGSFIPINIVDYGSGAYNSDMICTSGTTYRQNLNEGSYNYTDNRFVSWYANGSYEYDNRYIVSGSIRLDLTNFFGTNPDYRYKPMWSVGGTWKIRNEKFMDSVNWLDKLDLRASYGVNGNIALDQGPFMILSVGDYETETGGISYSISSPANDQLRWERTASTNVGLDAMFLNNRIEFTFDWYYRNSTDLLANDQNDPTTGFSSLMKNVGEMSNSGIEIALGADVIKNDQFRWHSLYNLSYNFNNVKKYNLTRLYANSYTGRPQIVEGKPADALYVYRFAGLNEEGHATYWNAQGERVLGSQAIDPEDVVYAGTTRPKFDMSFTNWFTYKNFDLSFMFIAKLGHKYRKDSFSGTNYINRHVTERWREPGDEETTIYPRLQRYSSDRFYFPYADIFIGKANYLKLRDVTLTYRLPEKAVSAIGLANAKLYFQARNLFTVTAKGVDIDPEVAEVNETGSTMDMTQQGYTSLPHRAEFYLGLSFTF